MYPKYLMVNGREQRVDDKESFLEFLGQFDIDESDVQNIMSADVFGIEPGVARDVVEKNYDGLLGDAYYQFIEGLDNILDELRSEVLDSLKADGRKKANQRAAVYKRLDVICRNLDSLIH